MLKYPPAWGARGPCRKGTRTRKAKMPRILAKINGKQWPKVLLLMASQGKLPKVLHRAGAGGHHPLLVDPWAASTWPTGTDSCLQAPVWHGITKPLAIKTPLLQPPSPAPPGTTAGSVLTTSPWHPALIFHILPNSQLVNFCSVFTSFTSATPANYSELHHSHIYN